MWRPFGGPLALAVGLVLACGADAAVERCAEIGARIVALDGEVEASTGSDAAWSPLALGGEVCVGELVRAGESGQAALTLTSGGILRLSRGSTLRIEGDSGTGATVLRLLRGILNVFSRRPHALQVDTPFADAAVEGTEFTVETLPDSARVTVLEGRVRVSNPQGEVRLAPGGSAIARAGKAPEIELQIHPRDAVRWALYYPPLGESRLPADAPPALHAAARLEAEGHPAAALARLDADPTSPHDAPRAVLRAELLLRLGRPAEASTELAAHPNDPAALALRAIIAVAQNDKDQALADARHATALAPHDSRALLAQSYAAQASFDIPQARQSLETAVKAAPDDALVRARLAEVQLMQADIRAAGRSATKAVALDPDSARAQTVAGFVALARIDTKSAKASFARALALDSLSPLARLGLGLATIRDGDLAAGRSQIELAVALDPDDALLRSYLGKAYMAERRNRVAGEEFATAKALDPNDPTPWSYDAILKEQENRPIEALKELEQAKGLSDDRAVYRSRLLLDQDRASRGVSLARVYNDLGFEQLGIMEASKSLAADVTSPAAHRFLADVYARRPRYEVSRASEILQAQLRQPLGSAPIPPSQLFADLRSTLGEVSLAPGFGEYDALFERNGINVQGGFAVGTESTFADEVIASTRADRVALNAGQFHSETDGFRDNADLSQDVVQLLGQAAASDSLDLQVEYRGRRTSEGDRHLTFAAGSFDPDDRFWRTQDIVRAGVHWRPTPQDDVAVNLATGRLTFDRDQPTTIGSFKSSQRINESRSQQQMELEAVHQQGTVQLRLGGSLALDHANTATFSSATGEDATAEYAEERSTSRIVYADMLYTPTHRLTFEAGSGLSEYHSGNIDVEKITPRLGVMADLTDTLRLRFGYSRSVKGSTIADQSLARHPVMGFAEIYDDRSGTTSDLLAAALDWYAAQNIHLGLELGRRLTAPANSSGQVSEEEERYVQPYLDWTPDRRVAIAFSPRWETYHQDNPTAGLPQRDVGNVFLPLSLRYFMTNGLSFNFRGSYIRQEETLRFNDKEKMTNSSLVLDAGIAYDIVGKNLQVRLDVFNILNQHVAFDDLFDRTTEEPFRDFSPDRLIIFRMRGTF